MSSSEIDWEGIAKTALQMRLASWAVFGYIDGVIRVKNQGSSPNEIIDLVTDENLLYAYIRVDKDHNVVMFTFVTWIGEWVSVMDKVKGIGDVALVKEALNDGFEKEFETGDKAALASFISQL